MGRSNADGWRISGGILMFGGSHDDGATSINVLLLDNDYANQGGILARLKAVWSSWCRGLHSVATPVSLYAIKNQLLASKAS